MKTFIKSTAKTSNGTSFSGVTIYATPNELIKLAKKVGADYYDGNTGDDKVNFDFTFETSVGSVFTVYDWKEYRVLDQDLRVEFHIGGFSKMEMLEAKDELLNDLYEGA